MAGLGAIAARLSLHTLAILLPVRRLALAPPWHLDAVPHRVAFAILQHLVLGAVTLILDNTPLVLSIIRGHACIRTSSIAHARTSCRDNISILLADATGFSMSSRLIRYVHLAGLGLAIAFPILECVAGRAAALSFLPVVTILLLTTLVIYWMISMMTLTFGTGHFTFHLLIALFALLAISRFTCTWGLPVAAGLLTITLHFVVIFVTIRAVTSLFRPVTIFSWAQLGVGLAHSAFARTPTTGLRHIACELTGLQAPA